MLGRFSPSISGMGEKPWAMYFVAIVVVFI